ncbi:hypothetical protein PGT21_016676 [Puccinia graminis f. sp. tritici]|uniref:Uncharacterized protein n=1 Tax=Puccinia graminis f. sp. tritici TaxID=56615 RepID=A0A5B0P2F3_PUCGR|nr:hypothetical protein PGT21_016676 [Puccinia graminis f. sp. tritici]
MLPAKPFEENEPDDADLSSYCQYLPPIIKDLVKRGGLHADPQGAHHQNHQPEGMVKQ